MQSAILAGYTEESARSKAYKLLQEPDVHEMIVAHVKKMTRRYEMTLENVGKELCTIAFSDIGDYLDWSTGEVKLRTESFKNKRKRRALKNFKERQHEEGGSDFEITLHDKLGALTFLGKYLGMGDHPDERPDVPTGGEAPPVRTWPVEIIGADGKTPEQIAELANKFMDVKKT